MKTEGVSVFFDSEVSSPEAVRLAAAVMGGRMGVEVSKAAGGLSVRVYGPGASAGTFANEALNQQCRIDLARVNSRIASIITTKALLSAAGEKPARRGRK